MAVCKSMVAATAVMASAIFAHGANVSSVTKQLGTLEGSSSPYTARSLAYKTASEASSSCYRSAEGWYAGLILNWASNKQGASSTKAKVEDGSGLNAVAEYQVYKNFSNKTPSGCGMNNELQRSGVTMYMKTTEWYIYVTPEFMYSLSGSDYTAKLTIADNEYTITVPHDIILSDGTHQWYPAVGLLGDKVYGDAQHLADQISVDNYTTVKFLSDPAAAGVTFGDGFAASDNGDGTWVVTMTHSHAWSSAVSADGTTLTAKCGNAGCPVGGSATVSLALSSGDKAYDGTAITASANFDEFFETIFPNASIAIATTKGGAAVEAINDVGEYTVTMTVTGLGDGQEHVLSRTVTISQADITGAALVLTPATTTYNGAEQTVTPSVTVGGVSATFEVDAGSSTLAATEIGTYSVTVNGTGNFTGTATATWSIVNTTGAIGGVAAAAAGYGSVENNTLTVTDTAALEFSDGAWYAGLALSWPMEKNDSWTTGGYAHYVKEDTANLTISAGAVSSTTATDKYRQNLLSGEKDFTYLSTTTWKVETSPEIVEAALAEEKTSLDYAMRAGAFVWGDDTEGDPDGVAFADYAIVLPLDEPVVFALGEGEAYDLGATVLTTTKIQLAAGASVTSDVAQTEGAIFTEATGYEIERTEEDGQYVYTTKFTHVHDWSVSKAANGYELVATCANPECDINNGEVKMWLDVGATEKTYDGSSVTRKAEFGEGFMAVYPDAAAVLTVNGVENGVINDAGEYEVVLTVTGVGEGTYTLSRTVTVSKVDITGAALVLTPATMTYNCAEQTVTPSVTVGGATATLNNGLVVADGSCSATEIGTYSVTVNGTGNFTGTAASANWSIVNTTGEPTSVTESAAGSMTKSGNDFTLTDSSKLEYDAENGVWYAGITIAWPMEKRKTLGVVSGVDYVSADMVKVTKEYGEVNNDTEDYTYLVVNTVTYVSTTTWKVGITPAIVEAALGEGKTVLEWTMRAGAISSDTYEAGVAFRDYTITIPLEGITLYDGDGKQVYPKTAGQTIIEGIKADIAEAVAGEVAENASAKIDLLAEVAGEGNEQDVADWVAAMKGESTPAEFFAELAQSDYVAASFKLDTDELITEASEVEVAEFGSTEGGFTLAVKIDGDDIEAARVKAAGIIRVGTDLNSFGPLAAERIEISGGGEMTVKKDAGAEREFFKIMIEKDNVVN